LRKSTPCRRAATALTDTFLESLLRPQYWGDAVLE
jgi:hypothetical protein